MLHDVMLLVSRLCKRSRDEARRQEVNYVTGYATTCCMACMFWATIVCVRVCSFGDYIKAMELVGGDKRRDGGFATRFLTVFSVQCCCWMQTTAMAPVADVIIVTCRETDHMLASEVSCSNAYAKSRLGCEQFDVTLLMSVHHLSINRCLCHGMDDHSEMLVVVQETAVTCPASEWASLYPAMYHRVLSS